MKAPGCSRALDTHGSEAAEMFLLDIHSPKLNQAFIENSISILKYKNPNPSLFISEPLGVLDLL